MMRRATSRLAVAAVTAWRYHNQVLMNRPTVGTAAWATSRRHSGTNVPSGRVTPDLLAAAVNEAEEQVRRRTADVTAVTLYLTDPEKGKPPAPSDADAATKALWNRNWTIQDLDRAKQDLRDAKQDLDRTYQYFDRVKQNLRDANTTPSASTLIEQHLAKYRTASLLHCQLGFSRRIGCEGAGMKLYEEFQGIASRDNTYGFTKQNTRAAALIGASGVGKTFLALTYPSGGVRAMYEAAGTKHVLIYAGFNFKSPLAPDRECLYLKKSEPNGAAAAVAVVVLGRVVAGLQVALNNVDDLDRPLNEDLHRVAENLDSSHLLEPGIDASTLMPALQKKAVELLLQLQDAYLKDGKLLTVLINVDEAQDLDEILPADPATGVKNGGRYALRCLRELQYHLKQETNRTVVMGFATGINPQLWLNTQTAGVNFPVDGRLTRMDDFLKIAETVCRDKKVEWDRAHKVAASLHYPRVRNMIGFLISISKDSDLPVMSSCKDTVLALMEAFVMNKCIPYSQIPEWCAHNNAKIHEAVPLLDYLVWPSILSVLHVNIDYNTLPSVKNIINAEDNTGVYFESIAFHTLSLLVALFYQPDSALCLGKNVAIFFREKQGRALSRALGLTSREAIYTTTSSFVNFDFEDKKRNYLPFEGTEDGLKGAMTRGVWKDFKDKVNAIPDGGASLFYCGGSAPFDYIMVRRVGNELKVVYMDAKYRSNTEETVLKDAKVLLKTAADVHQHFSKAEFGENGLKLVVAQTYGVCMITNVNMSKLKLKHIEELGATMTVLCPSTFIFTPWTDILYLTLALADQKTN